MSIDSGLDGEHKAKLQSSLHSREDPDLEIPKTEMIKVREMLLLVMLLVVLLMV